MPAMSPSRRHAACPLPLSHVTSHKVKRIRRAEPCGLSEYWQHSASLSTTVIWVYIVSTSNNIYPYYLQQYVPCRSQSYSTLRNGFPCYCTLCSAFDSLILFYRVQSRLLFFNLNLKYLPICFAIPKTVVREVEMCARTDRCAETTYRRRTYLHVFPDPDTTLVRTYFLLLKLPHFKI